MKIFCSARCRREVSATRVATHEWVGAGRRRYVWCNRCGECGALYAAPDPTRAPRRTSARVHHRQLVQLQRAGQLPLFPEKPRR